MRKKFLLMLLFTSASAYADWVKIDAPAGSLSEKFINTDTIRQSGPMNTMRRIWELSNLVNSSTINIASIKQYVEYDCKDRRSRVIEESSFSKHWAEGENLTVAANDMKPGNWSAIGLGGVHETIFNRVCPNG